MYCLRDIQDTVQQTAEAIAEVLKIEVEIADYNMVRVAGTGKYRDRCGHVMDEGFVYRHVLKTGKAMIIQNPGSHELCGPCPHCGNCVENAEVASPIQAEGKTIGVIGLISFDEEQARRLLDNTESLLRYLEKMSELIAGKIVESHRNRQREVLTNQLMTVVNLLHDGILVVNEYKQITNCNIVARKLLNMSEGQETSLDDIVDSKKIWKVVGKDGKFSGQVNGKRVPGQLFCDAFAINTKGQAEGAVIVLKDPQQIKKLVKDATVSEIQTDFSQILGESQRMKDLKEMAFRVAQSNSTLLIQGESGTGKELFARAVHQSSKRKTHSFIAINCGAIPENLLESELFGYEEGAFTGAQRGGKLGKFELAHHGTVFLDEIGDMPLHLQVKLLRVLQERRVERIGGTRSIPIDVRVIAATNRDLEQLMATGEFREDLYYRLHVIPLFIPPLRERKEDIPLLVRSFVEYYSKLVGKEIAATTPEAIHILSRYSWPGNVRELGNIIEYAVTMAAGDTITADILPKRIKAPLQQGVKHHSLNLEELERKAIAEALEIASESGNKEKAAEILGIGRATLYRKIKAYKILEKKTFF
ncbi:sigma 54-interacting transcriptional regulator [Acetonema longum]|uniref:Sigma-54 dependent transcription regulator n=1 Tax=Acetonema longum DSM 6540 TaxID=1009370 RepID=F7NDB3_9FIRM|nr:sigma 54-interacting transcriptional regulator [Acetonema longum]EGO65945.1 sigma-54 dependent transcription regulator [Acetonema longum DSM 6540]